ncbi:SWIM zinc finger family protein [Rhodococcus tibetensis]|uniref:SWIM zinc finger family protein n=1 Tax=Rhodococcus tibetensis TaxID=2965064 RepID=A0ABT1QKL6_9NOCA|nr:SWIM zinc finger family protein [Rhodococcus sp. FXJ9.536]MCQ4122801.1 SWIM zinc finger family protein [Rhodococcus sp. FXJ9.536]
MAQRWVDDLEQSALDSQTLKLGRAHAHCGMVGPLTFAAGLLSADVHTNDELMHVRILVEVLDKAKWGRVLTVLGSRSGHVAQLLSGTLPRELDEDLEAIGISLVPSMFDADATCTCEEWDAPCRHAAAVLYQAAWILDDDPMLLFLLRGREGRHILERRHDAHEDHSESSFAATSRPTPAAESYAEVPGSLPTMPAWTAAVPVRPRWLDDTPPEVRADDIWSAILTAISRYEDSV